jgi:hypothetical protein
MAAQVRGHGCAGRADQGTECAAGAAMRWLREDKRRPERAPTHSLIGYEKSVQNLATVVPDLYS